MVYSLRPGGHSYCELFLPIVVSRAASHLAVAATAMQHVPGSDVSFQLPRPSLQHEPFERRIVPRKARLALRANSDSLENTSLAATGGSRKAPKARFMQRKTPSFVGEIALEVH